MPAFQRRRTHGPNAITQTILDGFIYPVRLLQQNKAGQSIALACLSIIERQLRPFTQPQSNSNHRTGYPDPKLIGAPLGY
jgi:hypothetical protein